MCGEGEIAAREFGWETSNTHGRRPGGAERGKIWPGAADARPSPERGEERGATHGGPGTSTSQHPSNPLHRNACVGRPAYYAVVHWAEEALPSRPRSPHPHPHTKHSSPCPPRSFASSHAPTPTHSCTYVPRSPFSRCCTTLPAPASAVLKPFQIHHNKNARELGAVAAAAPVAGASCFLAASQTPPSDRSPPKTTMLTNHRPPLQTSYSVKAPSNQLPPKVGCRTFCLTDLLYIAYYSTS